MVANRQSLTRQPHTLILVQIILIPLLENGAEFDWDATGSKSVN